MPTTTLIQDSFNRADSTTTLGNADTGGAWSTSGTWGINSNQAYTPAALSLGHAFIDTGQSDVEATVTLATLGAGGNAGIIFRRTDVDNYWVLFINGASTNLQVLKRVAGAFTSVVTVDVAKAAGDDLRVVASGSRIRVFWNGAQISSFTDTFNQAATQHGIWQNNDNAWRLDDFLCRTLPTAPAGTGHVTDSFDRADAASLGTSDSGHVWQEVLVGAGITTNTAYASTPYQTGHAIVTSGASDVDVQVTVSTLDTAGNAGLVFRWQDSERFWILFINGLTSVVQLVRYSPAGATSVASIPITKAAGDIIKIKAVGSSIRVFHNGTELGSVTDTTYQSATSHGIWLNTVSKSSSGPTLILANAWRLNDFSVTNKNSGWRIGAIAF